MNFSQLSSLSLQFDILYLFNVLYALADQKQALCNLAKLAKPNALLVIFDYTDLTQDHSFTLTDFSGKKMRPIRLIEFETLLNESGWEIVKNIPLNREYEQWYAEFMQKLTYKKDKLIEQFGNEIFNKVHILFSSLLNLIRAKQLGGGVFYARLANSKLLMFQDPSPVKETLSNNNSHLMRSKL